MSKLFFAKMFFSNFYFKFYLQIFQVVFGQALALLWQDLTTLTFPYLSTQQLG